MTKEKYIPDLRFPEFELQSQYKKHLFRDLFQFSTGRNIKQQEAKPEFEIPCIRYGELYHMYDEVIYEIINRTNIDKSELLFSKGDEILLPSAGEDPLDIGSASALTLKNIAIGRTINILSPLKENVYSQIFVSYYINSQLKKKISTLAKGSSISNVYNSDLQKLSVLLPSIEEQQKIASFLTTLDQRIQLLLKKKEVLEEYKKGVMQKIFSQEIRFRDKKGNYYPDWEALELKDVIKRTSTGLNPRKNFKLGSGDNYYITIKNISKGKIDFNNSERINDDALKLINNRSDLSKNDIIMSSIGNIGESYLLTEDPENWDINESVFMIRPDQLKVLPLFLYYILTSDKSHIYFESNMTGSSFKSIKIGALRIMPCNLPCLEEQQKIASFLSSMDEAIESINVEIDKSKEFKKGLLQKMFV